MPSLENMSWLAVTFTVDSARADALADALLDRGAASVDVADADAGTAMETPLLVEAGEQPAGRWQRVAVKALFDAGRPVSSLVSEALVAAGFDPAVAYDTEAVADQDWVRATQDQFGPMQVSPRLWVTPTWSKAPASARLNLVIDPGLAFGTGSHATTRLCLNWLDDNVQGGEHLLDYGCGSGILAIAAMKMGATRACGIDIDAAAVVAARNNAMQNQVSVEFITADAGLDGVFDIVIANILANPLRLLAPLIARSTRPGGRVALSGILDPQGDELRAIYAQWFEMDTLHRDDGWVLLSGKRR
jgi:ribosomal protein L11 methyltransferase